MTSNAVADELERAERHRVPIRPLRDRFPDLDVDEAYRVQWELARRRIDGGEHMVGRKVGLTAHAVQVQLGVDQPDFGILFAGMEVPTGGSVSTVRLIQPKIEAEIAFVLAEDLTGDLTLGQVRDAVAFAVAALEIVDSRIENWNIRLVDTVADNGSSARFVLGATRLGLDEFEPKDVTMTMTINGQPASTGTGEACLGDPLNALLWLAEVAQRGGKPLRAGEVVLSGALGPVAVVTGGDRVRAEVGPLGTVSVRFEEGI